MRPTPPLRVLAVAVVVFALGCSDSSEGGTAAGGSGTVDADAITSDTPDPADTSPDPTASTDGTDGVTTDGTDGSGATQPDASTNDADDEATPADAADGSTTSQDWSAVSWRLEPVAALNQPTDLTTRPGDDDLWITEREGRVRLVERTVDAAAGTETLVQVSVPVLDISGQVDGRGEGGLLGLAFSPDGGRLYLHYTSSSGFQSIVSEFMVDGTAIDPNSERVVVRLDQPFKNHNGGDLHFGPDGLLYASLGDGGSADDPLGSGQDTSTLLGTLIRIDPSGSDAGAYGIPADNPFADGGGAPEIWSYGLRNPYRFAFDPATGDLWIGDVGQNRHEEIDFLPAGGAGAGWGANLGWNLMEGTEPFAGDAPADHVGPVYTYPHRDGGCSVTGGRVYRGSLGPELDGIYVFADYCLGSVTGLELRGDGSVVAADLATDRSVTNVIAFGQGDDGEVYVLEQGGRVSRLQPASTELDTTISSR